MTFDYIYAIIPSGFVTSQQQKGERIMMLLQWFLIVAGIIVGIIILFSTVIPALSRIAVGDMATGATNHSHLIIAGLATVFILWMLTKAIPPLEGILSTWFVLMGPLCVMAATWAFSKTRPSNGSDVLGSVAIILFILFFICFALQSDGDDEKTTEVAQRAQPARLAQAKRSRSMTIIEVALGEKEYFRTSSPYRLNFDGLVALTPEGHPECTIFADGQATLVPVSDEDAEKAYANPREFLNESPNLKHLTGEVNYRKIHREFKLPTKLEFQAVYRPVKIEAKPW